MGDYGMTAVGAKRPSSRASHPTEAKLKTNAYVLRRVVAAGNKRGTGLMRLEHADNGDSIMSNKIILITGASSG